MLDIVEGIVGFTKNPKKLIRMIQNSNFTKSLVINGRLNAINAIKRYS